MQLCYEQSSLVTLPEDAFSLPLAGALKIPKSKIWRPGVPLFRFVLAPEFSFILCLTM